MEEKIYVGLDLGSNSVGWAVTDDDYNIVRLKGKKAWGSRIFAEAKSKVDPRNIRSTRRRKERRKYRISLLQQLFAEEINKIDNTFFLRLDNASYLLEDKVDKGIGKNLIFKDKKDERSFYENFNTIWHLRKALIENNPLALSNLKHVYLALHHIIKYRGNFLSDESFSVEKLNPLLLDELNNCLKAIYYEVEQEEYDGDFITHSSTEAIKSILLNKNTKKKSKQTSIKELFNNFDLESVKKYIEMFYVIVTGGSFKLSNINKELESSVCFETGYDENEAKIAQELQNNFEIVRIAKVIYDFTVLNELLGDEQYLSNVMVNIYEEHKKDLEDLKNVIINIDENEKGETRLYDIIFKYKNFEEDKVNINGEKIVFCNYSSLVGMQGKKRAKPADFNTFINKVLKLKKDYVSESMLDTYQKLLEKSENKKLLRFTAHYSTSVIPHQIHLLELEKIIDNASNNYPFLKEIKEKLILLFKFRVHYSYGPLDNRSKFSNVERNSNEKITPWNIKEVINDSKTKEKFMLKLTNSCSYLHTEKVMPKASLTFERFMILDKLNVLKVNGESLIDKEKEVVINYLLSRQKTTVEQLKRFLASRYNLKVNDVLISNIKSDVSFEASSHYHLSSQFDIQNNFEQIEYYIYLATIYADDKKALKEILTNDFSSLSEIQVKCILTLPTKKWAPLSKTLLTDTYYTNEETGEMLSILDVMSQTNNNFQMTLYHSTYKFVDIIDQINKEKRGDMNSDNIIQEMLDNTPSIFRRSIHQALLILNDIEKASKVTPSKIFIEVTRNDDDNKKGKESTSREKEVLNFINSIDAKEAYPNINKKELLEEFETLEKSKIKNKHVYLYFKQMGIDVYTGKKIDLKDVLNSNKYDLDHIIPQSLIKDDSIDNLVLVDKEYNESIKNDIYPIPPSIKNERIIKLWTFLRKSHAISEKKYTNLMRSSEISLEEIQDFVDRQINVINYSNIVLKDILAIKYPNATIVFSKSQYPSDMRDYLKISKNRDVNDTHHAVDAYLNIFCGNVLSTTFSNVRHIYEKKKTDSSKTFNMLNTLKGKLKTKDKNNVVYFEKIKNTCLKRDIIVTYKVDYNNGAFYNATIEKASNSNALYAVKSQKKDTSKYGGYTGLSQSYIMAVEYDEKKKHKKFLLRVPTLFERIYKEDELLEKVVNNDKATNIKLIRKIHLNQKIKWKNGIYLLYTSGENKNKYKMAYQNYIDNDYLLYLDKANKKIEHIDITLDYQEFIVNKKEEKFVVSKEQNIKIFDYIVKIAKKPVYDSCNYIVKLREINKEVFTNLDVKQQIDTINNMIKCLSRNNEYAKFVSKELTELNKPNFRVTNNITNEHVVLLYESASGLFSHEVEI